MNLSEWALDRPNRKDVLALPILASLSQPITPHDYSGRKPRMWLQSPSGGGG